MFFETDRLVREDAMRRTMETESTPCVRCGKIVRFTANEDKVIIVECKNCGKKFEVVIQSKPSRAA